MPVDLAEAVSKLKDQSFKPQSCSPERVANPGLSPVEAFRYTTFIPSKHG